jgi:hypothetical protein
VTGLLLDRGLPVRAMVHREDDRSAALRAAGAEVVVGDLLEPADVYRVVNGCRRILLRHVHICQPLGSDRDNGGGRSGAWSERAGEHVADGIMS